MKSSRSGQSIIEAIVAISILTTGFLGIMGLLTKSFQLNRSAQDETKATYLAAENIEVVKNLIDHDVYSGIAFGGAFNGWGTCFQLTGYYKIDYKTYDCLSPSVSFSGSPQNTLIYFHPTGSPAVGLYDYNPVGGTKTIFTRDTFITVLPGSGGPELDVRSIVSWSPIPLTSESVTLEDHFYNWHPLTN